MRYVISDPCYHIQDSTRWGQFVEALWLHLEQGVHHFDFQGHQVFVHTTAHGDGLYPSECQGYHFPVDAGLIAAIPADLSEDLEASVVVEMSSQDLSRCGYRDGTFIFPHSTGVIVIPTEWEDEEDDDEWDDEDED
jgi:hypothetical protein